MIKLAAREYHKPLPFCFPASRLYYCAVLGIAFGAPLVLFSLPPWPESDLHAVFQLISTQLALVVGISATKSFVDRRHTVLLYVGAGFLGAACLDGMQLLPIRLLTPEPIQLFPGNNGNPADTFLALAMLSAAIACRRTPNPRRAWHSVRALLPALIAGGFAFACFQLCRQSSLPAWPNHVERLITFLMYSIAAMVFLRTWRHRPTRVLISLALSVAIMAVAQALFIVFDQKSLSQFLLLGQLAFVAGATCALVGVFSDPPRPTSRKFRPDDACRGQLEVSPEIFEHATDAMITISSDGNIMSLNAAAQKLFCYSKEQVIGRSVRFLIHSAMTGEGDQDARWLRQTCFAEMFDSGAKVRGRRANGSYFAAQLEVFDGRLASEKMLAGLIRVIVVDDGSFEQLSLENAELARDKIRMEQTNVDLTRSNVDLKHFAYVASHDLQEPLRKVISFCQLLRDEYGCRLDENAQTYIQFAVDGSLRMKALVQDLLTYSRVETQGKPLESVDATSACREAIDNLAFAIDEASAQVTCGDLPQVMADRAQLVRLFQNLIANAIKYRGTNPPIVHVACRSLREWAEFRVRDNGAGIAPEYHQRIFVIFQRLHPREDYAGTGIGLAVCKRIVERAGGRIWVESSLGTGSEFCFTLLKANHEINPGMPENDPTRPQWFSEIN